MSLSISLILSFARTASLSFSTELLTESQMDLDASPDPILLFFFTGTLKQ